MAEDRYGIGYSGIGYKTSGVKAVALAGQGRPAVYRGRRRPTSTPASTRSSRFLYVYVNKAPNKPLDPLVREFLKLRAVAEGQEIVVKDGYLPAAGQASTARSWPSCSKILSAR